MVAPMVAAAGISAVGSIVGGISGGKGAKKAAKVQQQAQREQIAAIERNQQFQYGLNTPTIETGRSADDRIAALLRLGGDASAADEAFSAWRDSTGYQTILDEGLRSTSNARFAGGAGISGGALKRLQERGSMIADGSFGDYMRYLGGVSAGGANARGVVAGVGTNSTNQFVNSSQVGAQGQIAIINGQTANQQNMIQNLVNSGLYAYGSSYRPQASPAMIAPSANYAAGFGRLPGF